jgi:murein DD-endopeptidase / murein LD-carboxypeptidase
MIMKILFEAKGKFIVLLIAGCQLLTTYCSDKLYRETSFQNIESTKEEKKLKGFMDAGTEKAVNADKTSANEIIKTARQYLGVPHCMGGTTLRCMDCSGLLVTVFARHGVRLPHNSEEQARYGKIIASMNKLTRGDLVFFTRSYKTHQFITHSGIYIGNNEFIHASSKKGVTITSLSDPWWSEKFIFGTRVFN